jgi:hypothetical protein
MDAVSSSIPTSVATRPWLQAVVLSIVAFAVLSPNLGARFVWDDRQQIVDSPTISDPTAPARYFTFNVVESYGSSGRGADGVDTYRPLFFVALWMIHRIHGADPFWFHLAVIVSHLGAGLLLWTLARRWLSSDLAAAAVFAVFVVHPVTAEGYLWPSAISEPLSVIGLLGAVLILDTWGRSDTRSSGAASVAGLVMLLGLLSKEAVVTALPALSLYLWRFRRVQLRALVGPWLAVVVFLALRVSALAGLQATGSGTAQRLDALRNLPVLTLDALRSMVILQPVGMRQLYWDYRHVTWFMSLTALAVTAAVALVLWRFRRRLPLALTAFAVTVCMLVPVALVSTVPGWGGFGRYLYLPWAITALALAEAGLRLSPVLAERAPRLRWAVAAVALVFLAFELVGLRHALDVFSSQEHLARAAIELQPDAPDGWLWLGNSHTERGDLPTAARCYAEAVAIAPGLYDARHNLAAALLHLGRPAEALEHEIAVRRAHGVTAEGAIVAVRALLELGRRDAAIEWLRDGLAVDPDNATLLELESSLVSGAPEPPPR